MSSNAYKALILNSYMPHLDWALGEEADRRGLLARNARAMPVARRGGGVGFLQGLARL